MLFTRMSKLLPGVMDADDLKVSAFMCRLWTDFAKNGRPGDEWPQYDSLDDTVHLKIKLSPEISSDFHRSTVSFWTMLLPKLLEKENKPEHGHSEL